MNEDNRSGLSAASCEFDAENLDFLDAINSDEIPRPTKSRKRPTLAEVENYVELTRRISPQKLELEEICKNALGFYLFLRYLREHGETISADFLYDVASSKTVLRTRAGDVLRIVIMNFLLPSSCGRRHVAVVSPLVHRVPSVARRDDIDAFVTICESGTGEEVNALQVSDWPLENVLRHFHRPSEDSPLTLQETNSHQPLQEAMDVVEELVFRRMKDKHRDVFVESQHYRSYFEYHVLLKEKVCEDDFALFRVLGRGGFGIVNGCKHLRSGKLYAMKVLQRKRVKSMSCHEACLMERNLLASLDTPFVASLAYAFQSPTELFLILELMTGGDLKYHLHRKGRFNSHETKYFAARTLLGLQAIHNASVAYRDLKPDNILMTSYGATKLSDFGLAATVNRKGLVGACGTRGYWAPEMMAKDENGKRVRYGLSVDWFSFGCVLYEFLTGVSPFLTEVATNWGGLRKGEEARAIDLATAEMDPFFDPEIFDPVAADLIGKLLIKDGLSRLGAHGAGEVMAHAYFDDIDWNDMEREAIRPPFIPRRDLNTKSQGSIGNFEAVSEVERVSLSRADLDFFDKWDFVRPQTFFEEAVMYLQAEEKYGSPKADAERNSSPCICG